MKRDEYSIAQISRTQLASNDGVRDLISTQFSRFHSPHFSVSRFFYYKKIYFKNLYQYSII